MQFGIHLPLQLEIERNFFNLIKHTNPKLTASLKLKDKTSNKFDAYAS
jgi:hypothetical protein